MMCSGVVVSNAPMTYRNSNIDRTGEAAPEPSSVAQLRREARKARSLGDAAFSDDARQQLYEIAASLDREATLMEAALAAKAGPAARRRPATAHVAPR